MGTMSALFVSAMVKVEQSTGRHVGDYEARPLPLLYIDHDHLIKSEEINTFLASSRSSRYMYKQKQIMSWGSMNKQRHNGLAK